MKTPILSVLLALSPALAQAQPLSPDAAAVVSANTAFALNLYGELRAADGNLFFSPYSLSTALAMAAAGARGETAGQMARVLQFTAIPPGRLPAAFGALRDRTEAVPGGSVRLDIANALWPQKGYPFLEDYLELLRQDYGAAAVPLDFRADPPAACRSINQWVQKQTRGKITNLVSPGSIDSQTRLLLVNAIYFLGNWASPFKSRSTSSGTFHSPGGREVYCRMMGQTGTFAYAETPDLQVAELPYEGNDVTMLIVLPKAADGIGALEGSLSPARLAEWLSSLKPQRIDVQLPKFTQTGTLSLADTLRRMGMDLPFSPQADFSGMDGRTDSLRISAVLHKAYVRVDEKGTEAAAATAVVMTLGAVMERPCPLFRADHPFLFLIRQRSTGSILFMGRVTEPKA